MTIRDALQKGTEARLFLSLSEKSKEGRATSILLSCMVGVAELTRALFEHLDENVGKRTVLSAFTEVTFKDLRAPSNARPDGLIVLTSGKTEWSALVEAKVGNSELDADQVKRYIELARHHKINAVITISNQFTPHPQEHPANIPANKIGKLALYHWSWSFILTQADLLIQNDEIEDADQHYIVHELCRFLTDRSAGIKGFEQMPICWPGYVDDVRRGAKASKNKPELAEIVSAWHQEERDLCFILTKMIGTSVRTRLPRKFQRQFRLRFDEDIKTLSGINTLTSEIDIPNAASPVSVSADIASRSITVSMRIDAPGDRVYGPSRVRWLLQQLKSVESSNVSVCAFWKGRRDVVPVPLNVAHDRHESFLGEEGKAIPTSFEIRMVNQLGSKFGSRKSFIKELEETVPKFHREIGQQLKNWQPSAPKVRKERPDAQSVSAEGLAQEYKN